MLQTLATLHTRIQLGAFTITQLSDGALEHHDAHTFFGTNADTATFDALANKHGLATDHFDFPITVTLIEHGTHRILVDAGQGFAGKPKAGRLGQALSQAGIAPGSITHVLITHLHADHIAGLLTAQGEPLFANAQHRVNPAEVAYWTKTAKGSTAGQNASQTLDALGDLVSSVRPGESLIPGIQLVDSNGHTPGHMCVLVDSGREKLFIAGDLANHPVWSIGQPDWHMRLDVDPEQAARTRHRLLGMIADESMLMAGYHMPFPALGRVLRDGDRFVYVPLADLPA